MDLWLSERDIHHYGHTFKVSQTLYHAVSPYQTVDVVETLAFGRMLLLDGLVMTTERDEYFYHELISHVPMTVHPNPRRVLVIGGGDGGTVREVLRHPSVTEVTLCEIDELVVRASEEFLPTIAGKLRDDRVIHHYGDGVAFVANAANAGETYDVILVDSTDPMGPGEGLFTDTFYTNVRRCLGPDGVMVAQSESPFANHKEVSLIYPMLRRVFPVVKPYVGPVPTYPGGYWSWAFCSNGRDPLAHVDEARSEAVSKHCQYYNPAIHRAAFAIPNFLQTLIEPVTASASAR